MEQPIACGFGELIDVPRGGVDGAGVDGRHDQGRPPGQRAEHRDGPHVTVASQGCRLRSRARLVAGAGQCAWGIRAVNTASTVPSWAAAVCAALTWLAAVATVPGGPPP